MSLYVIYGFDTASTLAEETRNPRVGAPRAVIAAVIGVVRHRRDLLVGRAVRGAGHGGGRGLVRDRPAAGDRGRDVLVRATLYLFVVVAAIFVCCMSILTSTIRLAFGMARDDQLPFSKTMAKVSPRLHTPVATCIIIGALAAVPFIQFAGAAVIAVGATASIYLSYLLGNLAFMRARTRGGRGRRCRSAWRLGEGREPRRDPVGRHDVAQLPHAVAANVRLGSRRRLRLLVHADHLEPETDPDRLLRQGDQLVDFKIDFLDNIPVIWTVFSLIAIVGAIYYFAVQKKKPFVPVQPPEEEDLSGIAPVEA